ncbi:MAG: hypothetical protein ACK5MQ_12565, partial [Pikeienuella sp.]
MTLTTLRNTGFKQSETDGAVLLDLRDALAGGRELRKLSIVADGGGRNVAHTALRDGSGALDGR